MEAAAPQTVSDELERLRRENKELRARVADLEAMFTMMPVPIAISHQASASSIEVNPAFAALLGVDTDINVSNTGPEALRLPYKLLRDGRPIEPEDLPLQKAGRLGKEVIDELEIVRDDGIHYHIYGSAKPLFDEVGNVRSTFAAFVDVSDRKRAERALQQSIQALRKANEELQQFAYAASHDLQEPLRSIASFTQLLERRYTKNDTEAAEYMQLIIEGVTRMNLLIADLLKYSRLGDAAQLTKTPFDLSNALQWAKLNLDSQIRELKATVSHGTLPEVIANESQIVQVFQNLLSNALKYRSDLPPLIHVSAEETPDDWIISVRDNGEGINPEYLQKDQEQIFGVFKRLHNRTVPGTGIGLALCRKIIQNHGGRIWVESDGKNGSNFLFTLPK
jgi:signal transduction histidine kinase